MMTPASSNFRTRSAAAGADNPTRRPSSLYERRASRCSSRRSFQSVPSSGLSVCKAIFHYSFLFLGKYSIFLCVLHSLLGCFQLSLTTIVMENVLIFCTSFHAENDLPSLRRTF